MLCFFLVVVVVVVLGLVAVVVVIKCGSQKANFKFWSKSGQ